MDFGSFSAEDHLNQQSNEQLNPPQVCCCKCGTNFGEQKWVQEFMAHLKPSIGEEVEKVLNRVILPYLLPLLQNFVLPPISSSLPHQAEPSASRSLRLQFKGCVPDALLTMTKIEDEGGSLEVELVDEFGKRVEVGPESCVKIKIDVLDGDFDVEDKIDWTDEDYNRNIAKPRDTKGALLKGKSEIVMNRGVANVSHISFTDNSATRINKNFRLGARVVKGLPPGVVVKAAVSDAFRVKERRLKRDRKHKKPSPMDDIWRLVNIRKDGAVHKRALGAGICTVKDLLQHYHTNPNEVQLILDVPEAKWNGIVENAEACKFTNECYKYYDVASGDGLLLDCAFNILSVKFKGQNNQLLKYKNLDDSQKEKADELRRSAYENRSELEKINLPIKQILDQELTSPSCIQGQEQQPPPPPSAETVVGGLLESPDAGRLMSNQMCIISPTNVQSLDATAADQAKPVELVHHHMTTPKFNSFQYDGDQLEALLQDPDMVPLFRELWANPPQWEEGGNVSQVAAHNHVTSKLLAACYVTKAASLFMISVQQDLSAPNKKRKLQ